MLTHLSAAFADLPNSTVALSGSVARGDYLVDDAGQVLSDVDVIPIVRCVEEAVALRAVVGPVLQQVADRFDVSCTAAITLLDTFQRARHAPYVTSMRGRSFLWDGLGLANGGPTRDAETQRFAWLAQPVTYYLAKAGSVDPDASLAKARRALDALAAAVGVTAHVPASLSVDEGVDRCVNILHQIVAAAGISLLRSSETFLSVRDEEPDVTAVFRAVRSATFLENQGIPFEISAMSAIPSTSTEPGE